MDQYEREIYRVAYLQGQADARSKCDVCPARYQDGVSVLIPAQDLLRRPGIEN